MNKPFFQRGKVTQTDHNWRLFVEEGGPGYRLAQLDDYTTSARSRFKWQAESTLCLFARVSKRTLPGTWGFGFWNDPFAVSFGLGGMARRLPALPNCAWFFNASPENHLSFLPDTPSPLLLSWMERSSGEGNPPVSGFLAQSFSAPHIPSLLLAPGALAAPLLFVKPFSKLIRSFAGKLIREDAKSLDVDVTQWHEYRLRWEKSHVEFAVDGEKVHETEVSPQGPLGLVIWIDNQFAAWKPDGTLRAGNIPNPPMWLDIKQ